MKIERELLKQGPSQFLAGCFLWPVLANWRDLRVEFNGDSWTRILLAKQLRSIVRNLCSHVYIFGPVEQVLIFIFIL